jgi:hypothetical protein
MVQEKRWQNYDFIWGYAEKKSDRINMRGMLKILVRILLRKLVHLENCCFYDS